MDANKDSKTQGQSLGGGDKSSSADTSTSTTTTTSTSTITSTTTNTSEPASRWAPKDTTVIPANTVTKASIPLPPPPPPPEQDKPKTDNPPPTDKKSDDLAKKLGDLANKTAVTENVLLAFQSLLDGFNGTKQPDSGDKTPEIDEKTVIDGAYKLKDTSFRLENEAEREVEPIGPKPRYAPTVKRREESAFGCAFPKPKPKKPVFFGSGWGSGQSRWEKPRSNDRSPEVVSPARYENRRSESAFAAEALQEYNCYIAELDRFIAEFQKWAGNHTSEQMAMTMCPPITGFVDLGVIARNLLTGFYLKNVDTMDLINIAKIYFLQLNGIYNNSDVVVACFDSCTGRSQAPTDKVIAERVNMMKGLIKWCMDFRNDMTDFEGMLMNLRLAREVLGEIKLGDCPFPAHYTAVLKNIGSRLYETRNKRSNHTMKSVPMNLMNLGNVDGVEPSHMGERSTSRKSSPVAFFETTKSSVTATLQGASDSLSCFRKTNRRFKYDDDEDDVEVAKFSDVSGRRYWD